MERLSTRKNELIIFCGETMARLTMSWYRAVIHQVQSSQSPHVSFGARLTFAQVCPPPQEFIGQERYSLVYLCRGRPDAVLDTVKLNSTIIGKPFW